jgi:hypothetical protein
MGLTLFCPPQFWSCSYSGLHSVRLWFIKATLEWLKESNPLISSEWKHFSLTAPFQEEEEENKKRIENERKELIPFLESLFNPSYQPKPIDLSQMYTLPILYEPWNKTPYSLGYFGLSGLKKFVVHSDCDGYFTYGDVVDILDLLSKIDPYLKKYFEDDEWYNDFIQLFKHSYQTKHTIVFQ